MLWCSSSNASIYILVVTTFRFSNRQRDPVRTTNSSGYDLCTPQDGLGKTWVVAQSSRTTWECDSRLCAATEPRRDRTTRTHVRACKGEMIVGTDGSHPVEVVLVRVGLNPLIDPKAIHRHWHGFLRDGGGHLPMILQAHVGRHDIGKTGFGRRRASS
jgi:hypothetical protein